MVVGETIEGIDLAHWYGHTVNGYCAGHGFLRNQLHFVNILEEAQCNK